MNKVDTNIFIIFKKIFVPSFCYEFDINKEDLYYLNGIDKKIRMLGAHVLQNVPNNYQFLIKTSILINDYRMGKSVVSIRNKDTGMMG